METGEEEEETLLFALVRVSFRLSRLECYIGLFFVLWRISTWFHLGVDMSFSSILYHFMSSHLFVLVVSRTKFTWRIQQLVFMILIILKVIVLFHGMVEINFNF